MGSVPATLNPERLARVAPADYVTVELAAAVTGYTVKAIQRKIESGAWLEGAEFVRAPDGRTLVSMQGYCRWARRER